MQLFPPTIIIRHRLENLNKCSVQHLVPRSDFCFITYPYNKLPDLTGYIILTLDAPPLSASDKDHGLLIIDATWRYAEKMIKPLLRQPHLLYRSLPHNFRTAYPRRQLDCPDPERGLASIEALFLSFTLLGRNTDGLLDNYHWKNEFLNKNSIN